LGISFGWTILEVNCDRNEALLHQPGNRLGWVGSHPGAHRAEWWLAALIGVIVLAFFLWAPSSGRYAVHPEHGVMALRRDERTQAINDKAARNGFVVTIGAIGGITLYFGSIVLTDVPVTVLSLVLALGILTYFVSDFWLRRA